MLMVYILLLNLLLLFLLLVLIIQLSHNLFTQILTVQHENGTGSMMKKWCMDQVMVWELFHLTL